METKIFDKDTLLDLMVNFIPLGIILFFIAAFTLYAPWGFDVRGFVPMIVIMVVMLIALAVLTYISGKAIAGDEKTKPVYAQGQAGLEGAKTIHELEAEADAHGNPVDATAAVEETETDGDAELQQADADVETESDVDGETTDKTDDDSASSA